MDMAALRLLTIATALGLGGVAADARPADGDEQGLSRRARLLETFDLDGDGTLSDEERVGMKQSLGARLRERFDANGNGVIDDDEKAAIREARQERRGKRAHRGHRRHRLEQFDVNGDNTLDEQERAAARDARRVGLLERFDANGDGLIDDDEKAAIREARRTRCGSGAGHGSKHGPRGLHRGPRPHRRPLDASDGPGVRRLTPRVHPRQSVRTGPIGRPTGPAVLTPSR